MTTHGLFTVLNYISVFVMLGCCTAIFTHGESRMQKLALMVCSSLTVVCIGFLIRTESSSEEGLLIGQRIMYAFVTHGMFMMLLFIAEYCRMQLPKWIVWLFHSVNLLMTVITMTVPYHSLFYRSVWVVADGDGFALEKEYGPLHTFVVALFAIYMAAAVAIAVAFSIKNMKKRSSYVWQLLIAVSLPCLSYVIPKMAGMHNDLQPMAFAVFAVMVLFMIYRYNLYDVDNIAVQYSLKAMDNAMIILDAQDRYKGCNQVAATMFSPLNELNLDADIRREMPEIADYLDQRQVDFTQNGRIYESELRSIRNGEKVMGRMLMFKDVTMQRSYTDLLRAQKQSLESEVFALTDISHRDVLTGVYNRRSFEETISLIRSSGHTANVAVMEVDLNGLKEINDTIGHAAGDELICGAAEVLEKVFSSYGKVFRTGGDEFVVISTKFIQDPAALLRQMLHDVKAWTGQQVQSLTLSFGCAVGNENPELSIDELLKLADRKMYENKRHYYEKNGIDRRKH